MAAVRKVEITREMTRLRRAVDAAVATAQPADLPTIRGVLTEAASAVEAIGAPGVGRVRGRPPGGTPAPLFPTPRRRAAARADGIFYATRHHNSLYTVALFERAAPAVAFRRWGVLGDRSVADLWVETDAACRLRPLPHRHLVEGRARPRDRDVMMHLAAHTSKGIAHARAMLRRGDGRMIGTWSDTRGDDGGFVLVRLNGKHR